MVLFREKLPKKNVYLGKGLDAVVVCSQVEVLLDAYCTDPVDWISPDT